MIPEHMHVIRDLSKEYNVRTPDLMETYTNLQTKYLRRDLNDPKRRNTVSNFIECAAYGTKALEVMDRYLKIYKR